MAATYRPQWTQPSTAGNHQRPSNASSIPGQPEGTFRPGTKVQVGTHRVIVERYLSSGGFAHVYVVRVLTEEGRGKQAVLKRVAVADKEKLTNMRNEVDTMKKLRGHKHIVTYIDSHASQLQGAGYEVFLLMEFCTGGGLIDFMNTRLKNRLTEPEILQIFTDTAEGVACMHYLEQPLLHRDLKIENILITTTSSGKRIYKLCDFGSTAPPRPAGRSQMERALIEEDIKQNTTFQYNSPEMVDVNRNRPIDEKSDIWALGVFLYKLCYYTTPFEEAGQMAILTASFKYPAHPRFSDRLKRLIAIMLLEDQKKRPNIYEVLKEACDMRGLPCPVKDIYSQRTESEARRNQKLPDPKSSIKSPPVVGAVVSAPEQPSQALPDVVPMRRGRPNTGSTSNLTTQASSQRGKDDPFAALDSKDYATRVAAVDELSQKFPALDDFSLLQSKDTKYQFKPESPAAKRSEDLQQRVTIALADQAFANKAPTNKQSVQPPRNIDGLRSVQSPEKPAIVSMRSPPVAAPQPIRAAMVSTGTMTAADSPPNATQQLPDYSNRPVWRVPDQNDRASKGLLSRLNARPQLAHNRTTSASSFRDVQVPKSPSSTRPSLEGNRPSLLDLPPSTQRSHSVDSATDHHSRSAPTADEVLEEPNVASDMDFLRSMEDETSQKAKSHHRRTSSKLDGLRNLKHNSIPSGRGILSGRLGDAFKRFEGSHNSSTLPERSSSRSKLQAPDSGRASKSSSPNLLPMSDPVSRLESHPYLLDPSTDEVALEEIDQSVLSPEVRREIERRRLSAEERRVAEAAAAWRAQTTGGAPGRVPSARASAIQSRVKNLLDESGRSVSVRRTAEGYGKYTDHALGGPGDHGIAPIPPPKEPDVRISKNAVPPLVFSKGRSLPQQEMIRAASPVAPPKPPRPGQSGRPNAPPKPVALRTGSTPAGGVAPTAVFPITDSPITMVSSNQADDDWETDFSKRYPSLSLELVEAEIASDQPSASRSQEQAKIRDV